MPCTPFTLPGGARGILCTRGPRPRCACGKPATLQCDAPSKRRGGTCDRHICPGCAVEVGADRHLCQGCAAQVTEQADRVIEGRARHNASGQDGSDRARIREALAARQLAVETAAPMDPLQAELF